MAPAPDSDVPTLHVRCGSDLHEKLRRAGFIGEYLEYADPFCQGPVLATPDWLARRAAFVAGEYGWFTNRELAEETRLRDAAERALEHAAHQPRVVIWVEHDSYDQLFLARCLAQFQATPPRLLELIAVDHHPGITRFTGLGQVPDADLPALWRARCVVTQAQMQAGAAVWNALRAATPLGLAHFARNGVPGLPLMGPALRRHCQELPGMRDGLSETERLVLRILADGPLAAGRVFHELQLREALPWLGDIMLAAILARMKQAREPAIASPDMSPAPWPRAILAITAAGRAVLAGRRDYRDLGPPARWLGGVHIPAAACWHWDDAAGTAIWA